jgi:LysR family hydrogen peroxide-inducible transcriptional activator
MRPHSFSLRQLQYAVAVADGLSFRGAALACHVSQPSLSAQVAELESALGVQLFERDRKRVIVTAAGRELVARARRLLLEADDLRTAAAHAGDPFNGRLRIGVIPTVSPYLLPHATPKLRRAFERLTVVWTEDKTDVLARALEAGDLDAAIVALEAEVGEVEAHVLAKDPFVLAAPIDHPLARSERACASDLGDQSVLLLDDGHCFRDQVLSVCGTEAEAPEFRATSLSTLVQMVAGGAGVTLLPALSLPTETRRARLHISTLHPTPSRTIALVWRRGSPLGPALEKIAEVIEGAYPDDQSVKKRKR